MKRHPLAILFCTSVACLFGSAWFGHQLKGNPHGDTLAIFGGLMLVASIALGSLWVLGVVVWVIKKVWLSSLTRAVSQPAGFRQPLNSAQEHAAKVERGKGDFTGGRSFIPK